MPLNERPDRIFFEPIHYLFVELIGPFHETAPAAWGQLHAALPTLGSEHKITKYLSMYKFGPQIYRAGVAVEAPPESFPEALRYFFFTGGNYARFVLTGSYMQLAEATGRTFKLSLDLKLPMREDFYLENYLNDPRVTPVEQLVTEILFPVE